MADNSDYMNAIGNVLAPALAIEGGIGEGYAKQQERNYNLNRIALQNREERMNAIQRALGSKNVYAPAMIPNPPDTSVADIIGSAAKYLAPIVAGALL